MSTTPETRLVQHGFNNIEIEKAKLLEIIRANKEKHIEEFNKSVKAYEVAKLAYAQEFWAQLSENIGLLKRNVDDKLEAVADAVLTARDIHSKEDGVIDLKDVNASVSMYLQPKVQLTVKKPVSHEKDYTVAIRGLELSTAEFVYVDQSNFSKYVLDEWDWKADFSSNNTVLFSGASIANNSYFNVHAIGSGCYVATSGDAMTGNVIPYVSGCSSIGVNSQPFGTIYANSIVGTTISGASISSLGAKSSELYSSIINSTEVK